MATSGFFFPMLRPLVGAILMSVCAGCVDLRMLSKPAFPPEVLQQLSQGNANRDLVSKTLGRPVATKAKGKYWFYISDKERWLLIGSSMEVLRDYEWVGVQFDDSGQMMFIEYNDDLGGCLSNGLCQYSGLFSKSPSKAVMTAPKIDDVAAKSYQAGADECAVYLYHEQLPWPARIAPVTLSIDGKPLGTLDAKTYLFLTHPRGEIGISAYQFKISTPCKGGGKLYIRAVKAMDWSWETGEDLAPVDAVEGEAAIRERQLALLD